MRAALGAITMVVACALNASAQKTPAESDPDEDLVRIETSIAAARLADARTALAKWNNAHPTGQPGVSGNTRAHALALAGRLATTWGDAEQAWVAVALGYPISPWAPEAMLRLGQGLLAAPAAAAGSATRAVAYLERLVNDYPNSPLRAQGFLWLTRAYAAAGRSGAACARIREAASLRTDSVTNGLIASEQTRVCTAPRPPSEPPR
jgi:TolA-binding protein